MPGNRLLPIVAAGPCVAVLCVGGFLWWRMRAAAPVRHLQRSSPLPAAQRLNEPLTITLSVPADGLLAAVHGPGHAAA